MERYIIYHIELPIRLLDLNHRKKTIYKYETEHGTISYAKSNDYYSCELSYTFEKNIDV